MVTQRLKDSASSLSQHSSSEFLKFEGMQESKSHGNLEMFTSEKTAYKTHSNIHLH